MKEVIKEIKTTILTRTELSVKYKLSKNIWNQRHNDLLEHLSEFMDIEE